MKRLLFVVLPSLLDLPHAFAHYYLSLCHEKRGSNNKSNYHMRRYFDIVGLDEEWREYAAIFDLPS